LIRAGARHVPQEIMAFGNVAIRFQFAQDLFAKEIEAARRTAR
jgi:hypothetical protein